MKPGLVDRFCLAFGRPWVFALAAAFILTPTQLLLAAAKSGAAFLKIGTGARAAALGGAYTALADDADAIYYNPGALAGLNRREFSATHANHLLGAKFDFIGFVLPAAGGSFGLGVTRLTAGSLEGRGADRSATADFSAQDTAYTLGYGRQASARTRLGGNVKYLRSSIAGYSASGLAFDLGAQTRVPGRPLTVGVSALNMGNRLRFLEQSDPLPFTLAAGAAYELGGALRLAAELKREVHDGRTALGLGTEYALLPGFALRAGYGGAMGAGKGTSGTEAIGALGGVGGGFGLRLGRYRADYSFSPFGELGGSQKISLGASF